LSFGCWHSFCCQKTMISAHPQQTRFDWLDVSWTFLERTYTPSVIDVSVGGCTVKQAMYHCYHRLISWRATFSYCQMCWLLVWSLRKAKEWYQNSSTWNVTRETGLKVSSSLSSSLANFTLVGGCYVFPVQKFIQTAKCRQTDCSV